MSDVNDKKEGLTKLTIRKYKPLVRDRMCIDTIAIKFLKEKNEFFKGIFDYSQDFLDEIDTIHNVGDSSKYSLTIKYLLSNLMGTLISILIY